MNPQAYAITNRAAPHGLHPACLSTQLTRWTPVESGTNVESCSDDPLAPAACEVVIRPT